MAKTTAVIEVPATITSKFNIVKTQEGFQKIADKISTLEYNEDGMPEILETVNKAKAVIKKIEEAHTAGKAPSLLEGRQWDLAKNTFIEEINNLIKTPVERYTKLAADVAEKKRKQDAETARITRITTGIETNAVAFAAAIAGCQTTEQLLEIERKINLEKTRKEKYDEFLPKAVTRFNELNALLKDQKHNVSELEKLRNLQATARLNNDDQAVLDLQDELELKEYQIEEHKIVVQEAAINQTMEAETYVSPTVFSSVKAKRTVWKFEMVDQKEVMKKNPELLVISLDDTKVKEKLNTLKEGGVLTGKTEFTLNGIRFYEEKTYI